MITSLNIDISAKRPICLYPLQFIHFALNVPLPTNMVEKEELLIFDSDGRNESYLPEVSCHLGGVEPLKCWDLWGARRIWLLGCVTRVGSPINFVRLQSRKS
jgi:hypothetical protein